MKNLYDFFEMIDTYTRFLREQGFEFTPDGYPVFKKEMFLTETPTMLVPVFQKNNEIVDKKHTVLCFFCGDVHIYRRLDKLLDEMDVYKEYLGVVEPDVTVTKDMDVEWQRAVMLFNQLALAVFASQGIKIVINTRAGLVETYNTFKYLPKGVMVASGFRGSDQKGKIYDCSYIAKMMRFMPQKTLIYGSCHYSVLDKMNKMGLDYKVYPAFRDLCKEVA